MPEGKPMAQKNMSLEAKMLKVRAQKREQFHDARTRACVVRASGKKAAIRTQAAEISALHAAIWGDAPQA